MRTWTELFGVADEAIVGTPDPYRAAEKDLSAYLDELQVVIDSFAVSWGPVSGFEGLAAESFNALTIDLADQLRTVPGPIERAAATLSTHADELDDLILESTEELRIANDRFDLVAHLDCTVRDLRLQMATGGPPAFEAGVEADLAERSRQTARDHLERSRRVYDRLRQEEEDLNTRTALALASDPLPRWLLVFDSVAGGGFSAVLDGPTASWLVIRQVFLEAGIDLVYPSYGPDEQARGEGCHWIEDGVLHITVGGPRGGEFAVGVDISPGVYAAVVAIVGGNLPDFRSWNSIDDLNDNETAALYWAMGTNFGVGESGQTQMMGTNGAWQNYIEGGEWTPQPIETMDGFELATELGDGGDVADEVLQRLDPYRHTELCPDGQSVADIDQ